MKMLHIGTVADMHAVAAQNPIALYAVGIATLLIIAHATSKLF